MTDSHPSRSKSITEATLLDARARIEGALEALDRGSFITAEFSLRDAAAELAALNLRLMRERAETLTDA